MIPIRSGAVTIPVALVLALAGGCAPLTQTQPPDREEMYIRASALTKLSAAVESTVRYKNPPPELSDRQLLTLATQHDAILLDNFKGYTIRVLRKARHSVVLVCDATGNRALLEDAGCSGPMDRHRWMGEKPEPCEFTIDAKKICDSASLP
jgi:hypothetical protein